MYDSVSVKYFFLSVNFKNKIPDISSTIKILYSIADIGYWFTNINVSLYFVMRLDICHDAVQLSDGQGNENRSDDSTFILVFELFHNYSVFSLFLCLMI